MQGIGRVRTPHGSVWASVAEDGVRLHPQATVQEMIAGRAAAAAARPLPPAAVQWDVPFEPDARILCVGVNYAAHLAELGRPRPSHPSLFIRWPSSLVAHGDGLRMPRGSLQFDFEGEVAVVIGRDAAFVAPGDGAAYVYGYTAFGDHSVRDWQQHSAQVTPGKNFDASGACGPWVVASGALPAGLRLRTKVNGELRQDAVLDDLIFDAATLIEYVSQFTRLRAGDVIATGTPGGVGMAHVPPRWLQPGDRVAVEVGSLRLENVVVRD